MSGVKERIHMVKKLFVGSLSYDVDQSGLEEVFSEFGTVVSAQVIKDRDTGRSRGFGFVEMETQEEAEAAIKGLDGKEINGRSVVVSHSKENNNRSRDGFRGAPRSRDGNRPRDRSRSF